MSVGFCRHLVLYPQNGDRIVTVDYITSVYLNAPAMVHLQRRSAVITRPRFLTFAADRFTYYSHFHFFSGRFVRVGFADVISDCEDGNSV